MKHRGKARGEVRQRVVTALILPAAAVAVAVAAVTAVSADTEHYGAAPVMFALPVTSVTSVTSVASAKPVTRPPAPTASVSPPRRTVSRAAQRPPVTNPQTVLSMAPCPSDSVEAGLQPDTIRVHRAVCHAFPQIVRYGGLGGGEHANGKAIDIMTTDQTLGYQIADFLKAHASELNLFDVIYRQHIWTPVRAGEGWRSMADRGSLTANHFDHVHVSIN